MFATTISERERHDRIVALAGQVTWIRSVGGSVLRAEMVGDDPLLEVEEDSLFRGFNHLSGLAPDTGLSEMELNEWLRSLPVSSLRQMTIAQTGALIAKGVALSGCSPCCGWHPDPGYLRKSWPGASSKEVLGFFCRAMDVDEETESFLYEMIQERVQAALFENWLCVHSLAWLIFTTMPAHVMFLIPECMIKHPSLISAETAEEVWWKAEQAMVECLPEDF
jgi:hypothetical protein